MQISLQLFFDLSSGDVIPNTSPMDSQRTRHVLAEPIIRTHASFSLSFEVLDPTPRASLCRAAHFFSSRFTASASPFR
jgi:hypothetical protein